MTSAVLEITASVDHPLSVKPRRPEVRASVYPTIAPTAYRTPSSAAGLVNRSKRSETTSSSAMTRPATALSANERLMSMPAMRSMLMPRYPPQKYR